MLPKEVIEELEQREEEEGYVSMPLLTVSESARYLGVGRKILFQLIEHGRIRAVKSKGATLIEKKSLDAFRKSGSLA